MVRRTLLACTFVALGQFTLARSTQGHFQKDHQATLETKVIVYAYADLAPDVLAKAEKRAEAIFQELEIKVVWVDSSDLVKRFREHSEPQKEQEEFDSIDVTLRILPHSRVALKSSALGEALPCQLGKDPCIANVFMNRVGEQTDVEMIGADQVLGHAMAHEIGHILLGPNSHSARGLMKAQWGPVEMKLAVKGDLLFTAKQAEIIRNNLTKVRGFSLKVTVHVFNYAGISTETWKAGQTVAARIRPRWGRGRPA